MKKSIIALSVLILIILLAIFFVGKHRLLDFVYCGSHAYEEATKNCVYAMKMGEKRELFESECKKEGGVVFPGSLCRGYEDTEACVAVVVPNCVVSLQ